LGIRVSNGAGVALDVVLGTAVGAMEGIDRDLGEVELPPLPPAAGFDVRLAVPGSNGSRTDLRAPSGGELIWAVEIQAGSGGYPLTVTWDAQDLPDGMGVRMVDAATGGRVLSIDMREKDSVQVTNPVIDRLTISSTWPSP
jgi:hypothetical protein